MDPCLAVDDLQCEASRALLVLKKPIQTYILKTEGCAFEGFEAHKNRLEATASSVNTISMFHPSSVTVAEVIVAWACIVPLLYPRADPLDIDFFGGDVSRGFRITFFAVGVLLTVRLITSPDFRIKRDDSDEGRILFFAQVALESFLNSLLSVLMPYLLQWQLQDRINIRPGRNLVKWLFWILLLQFIGTVGRSYVDERCWAIKRVGDSLSFFPVLSSAKLHFRIIPGQMKVIHQTLTAMEWMYFLCTWMAVASYALFTSDDTHWDIFRGFRVAGFFLPRVRLFYHGLMLNAIDEAFYNEISRSEREESERRSSQRSSPPSTGTIVVFGDEEMSKEMSGPLIVSKTKANSNVKLF